MNQKKYFISETIYYTSSGYKENEKIIDEEGVINLLKSLNENYQAILKNVNNGNKYLKIFNKTKYPYSSEEYRLLIICNKKAMKEYEKKQIDNIRSKFKLFESRF